MSSPKIFGILNITEDSFFDGNLYLEEEKAIKQAQLLKKEGAWAIDIGAASSHPDAKKVDPAIEINRLKTIIPFLKKQNFRISVDSCQPEVQLYAMKEDVHFLNDIRGFGEPAIYDELAKSTCGLILMHSIQKKTKAERKSIEPEANYELYFRIFFARGYEN